MKRKIIRKSIIQTSRILLAQRAVMFVLLFLAAASFPSLYGQATNSAIKPVNPPYIARTSNFMMILFHLKAGEAQKLLPANVKVKSDDKGLVTGGMEIYTTDQIYGVPKYTIAFIYVEISGEESNSGTSGNWPVWGMVNNDTSLQNFRHFFNYPYHHEKRMTIEKKGTEQVATVGDNGGEGLTLKLRRKTDRPVAGEGLATIVSQSLNGRILKTEIPWLANGNEANIVSFEVRAGSNKVLETIRGAKPFYGQISTNVFSYTRPITQ